MNLPFSKRQKATAGTLYSTSMQTATMSDSLRVKIEIFCKELCSECPSNDWDFMYSEGIYRRSLDLFCREHGCFFNDHHRMPESFFYNYIKSQKHPPYIIDMVEILLTCIINHLSNLKIKIKPSKEKAIFGKFTQDMNEHFRQDAFGLHLIKIDGRYIFMDSDVKLIADLITDPAIIQIEKISTPTVAKEIAQALNQFRSGNFELCIIESCKALESTMKYVLKKKRLSHEKADTVSKLVERLVVGAVLPSWKQESMNHLIGLMKSDVATQRNKTAGHGAGTEPRNVDAHYARLCFNSTLVHITFLLECLS